MVSWLHVCSVFFLQTVHECFLEKIAGNFVVVFSVFPREREAVQTNMVFTRDFRYYQIVFFVYSCFSLETNISFSVSISWAFSIFLDVKKPRRFFARLHAALFLQI